MQMMNQDQMMHFVSIIHSIYAFYVNHLQLGILLKENNKLKKAKVLIVREEHTSVIGVCRGAARK